MVLLDLRAETKSGTLILGSDSAFVNVNSIVFDFFLTKLKHQKYNQSK